MATNLKTPGVYIQELNAFPNAVVGVPTGVPAFIGYTEYAMNGNTSLLNVPTSITSMVEFHQYFGGAPYTQYNIETSAPDKVYKPDFSYDSTNYYLTPHGGNFMLYNSMNHFFSNGGGQCYIVSIGTYGLKNDPNTSSFFSGLNTINLLLNDTQSLISICNKYIPSSSSSSSSSSSPSSSSSSSAPADESNASKKVRGYVNTVVIDGQAYVGTSSTLAVSSILGQVKAAVEGFAAFSSNANMTNSKTVLLNAQSAIYSAVNTLNSYLASPGDLNFTQVLAQATAILAALNGTASSSSSSSSGSSGSSSSGLTPTSSSQAINIIVNTAISVYIPFQKVKPDDLTAGIDLLRNAAVPTIVVIPDAMSVDLSDSDAYSVQQAMLNHCGGMQSRVALLDIRNGWKGLNDPDGSPVEQFRDAVASNFYDYGASYYPWLNTTVISQGDVNFSYLSLDGITTLQTILYNEVTNGVINQTISAANASNMKNWIAQLSVIDGTNGKGGPGASAATLSNIILGFSNRYGEMMASLLQDLNLLPPSPAMSGIYNAVDNLVGVWKAPANVAMSSVVSPTVQINDFDQQDLNAPLTGKAINAIRAFTGEGVLVWGARTMDANSLDWRYINVRRTMIFLEQSIKIAAKAYVFQPNVANTWVSIQSMISNFLNSQWKAGALAGASPADAYSVQVGLGSTMTADDILNGIMNITVLVAISRPAEFIVITFQQQMQKS